MKRVTFYTVQVIDFKTKKVVKQFKPTANEHRAEKIADGVFNQMNPAKYYVFIKEELK